MLSRIQSIQVNPYGNSFSEKFHASLSKKHKQKYRMLQILGKRMSFLFISCMIGLYIQLCSLDLFSHQTIIGTTFIRLVDPQQEEDFVQLLFCSKVLRSNHHRRHKGKVLLSKLELRHWENNGM